MKKILLSTEKNYYKANLHCHSNISDGKLTPKELKEIYMREGYSVIAYTDHDVLLSHSDLNDEDFLALNGFECEINNEEERYSRPYEEVKECHLCYIALEPDNLVQPCWHREKYLFANAPKYKKFIKFDDSKPDFEREYTPEGINRMIDEGRKNGFFITYNHPAWSLETLNEYGKYKGMNAMEICNYACLSAGYADYNERVYDDMLMGGQKIYCIAADDNHNGREDDSFGGFTVINADKLEYRTITKALEDGNFYASMGPEIYNLWYEDGKIGIECSDTAKIVLNTGVRRAEIKYEADGSPVSSAVFSVKENDRYVRIMVTDASGKHVNTNAYFTEDLMR